MIRVLRNASLYARCLVRPPTSKPALNPSPSSFSVWARPLPRRLYSSGEAPKTAASETGLAPAEAKEVAVDAASEKKEVSLDVKDVSNKELKMMIDKYFGGDEEALQSILEGILRRKLVGKHEETDDEVMEEIRMQPIDGVKDTEFESDFEDMHDTDEEIDNLYDAGEIVKKKMVQDEYFNMSDMKWDEIIAEAIRHRHLENTKECEQVLEDMLSWDKLLPDEMKKEVEEKYSELGDMCERGELQPKEAFEQFKKFEDEMVMKYAKMMEKEAPQFDEIAVPDKKKELDDPPGEGPILRWQTRVVFAPGGDAWHPKNRKVKMAVTVKELGLSKYQFRRLRELVGKRYNPGKDELTITSERFEHREENRKDCLRTLLSLIEEAGKANKLVDDARASYVKNRLRANPAFMERLRAKTEKMRASSAVPA
ncbi:uncharacterized protein LOC115734877 [Rhodamnia argentea]|uniref:Uncharacterized protein LOC115734877 n=1 Tax=Rhodamnia argentea TaxID=178133 RepID=A0A8B8NI26_9MYRT|nr:uncharacterized protein LOC115734877 [Rhodamnia argentea]